VVNDIRRYYRYASAAAVCIAAAGCGDATRASAPPTDAAPLERAAIAARTERAHGSLVRRTNQVAEGLSASATITPEGGWLSIPGAGLVVWFPKGAVDVDLVVTASVIHSSRIAYDFQPHGTVFNVPIYVAQLLSGTELDSPRSGKNRPSVYAGYLANGSADVSSDGIATFAEVFNAAYVGSGKQTLVVFQTSHFSGYAMASGRKGSESSE
jgi:hypothetical protein